MEGDGCYWAMSTDHPLGNTDGIYVVEGQNVLFSGFLLKFCCWRQRHVKQRDLWVQSVAVRDGRDGGPGLRP